jgi:signal transduction histidine kinase
MIFVMKDQGVLPYNNFTRYTIHIGSAIEVILLSFALADRINILKKEKEASQEEALRVSVENERIIKEQNIVLEERVKDRTFELEESNTELNNTYSDLKIAQSKLVESEKMASLGQLTAGIAHEINNPINFVTANVNPLKRDIADIISIIDRYQALDPEMDMKVQLSEIKELADELELDFLKEEMDELIAGIGEGASRTAEIVKGLRNFSRLDEVDSKFANINEGLESTLKILETVIKANQVNIEHDFAEIDAIECYPGKLNQLFMNVLMNAIQAVGDNDSSSRFLVIETSKKNNAIEIRIKDNGVGMPEEVRTRIFEPFYTTKDVGKGTGLGLSIVYSIIEMHNGTIDVHSKVGEGTEFVIRIPLKLS